MHRILLASILLSVSFSAFAAEQKPKDEFDKVLSDKIDLAMKEIGAIKVGMTRADLMKVMVQDGGLMTRDSQRYLYKKCFTIIVDVEFELVGEKNLHDNPNDKIVKISKPYLDLPRSD